MLYESKFLHFMIINLAWQTFPAISMYIYIYTEETVLHLSKCWKNIEFKVKHPFAIVLRKCSHADDSFDNPRRRLRGFKAEVEFTRAEITRGLKP